MRLSTMPPSVPVSARCAPMTSLFRRVTSAPVCVRVKNAIGSSWTCRKSRVRSSRMNRSPIVDDSKRSTIESAGDEHRDEHESAGEQPQQAEVALGDRAVDDEADQLRRCGGDDRDGDDEAM
jgi:hypothetical protein